MVRTCQVSQCENPAIWAVKVSKEVGSFYVCKDHYGGITKIYEKLGYVPTATLLS